jgi:hypothetical protein
MKKGKFFFILLVIFNSIQTLRAADSLEISINRNFFMQNDSVHIEAWLPGYTKQTRAVTLHLWIENIKTHQRWQYRYPLLNGYVKIDLLVNPSIQDGVYAFSFLLNRQFFAIRGRIVNGIKKDTAIQYLLLTKNSNAVIEQLVLGNQKNFILSNLVYPDTAFFVFSPIVKKRVNPLELQIATPLDSSFTPVFTKNIFISIGKKDTGGQTTAVNNYLLNTANYNGKRYWNEVVIIGKRNALAEKFTKENSTPLFSSIDEIVLDGLGSDEMANAPDLFTYLSFRIPGLSAESDSESGNRILTWRKHATAIYLNEYKLGENEFPGINPDDIAIIKFFRYNPMLSNSEGGVLAIYTKTPGYQKKGKNKYSFKVMGYDPLSGNWQ